MAALGQFSSETRSAPVLSVTGDKATASANTATTLTYTAVETKRHAITGVIVSYSGSPTNGRLTIADGSNVILDLDITASGPLVIPFPCPKAGEINSAMTITLAAGGTGVVGKVNVMNHFEA